MSTKANIKIGNRKKEGRERRREGGGREGGRQFLNKVELKLIHYNFPEEYRQ